MGSSPPLHDDSPASQAAVDDDEEPDEEPRSSPPIQEGTFFAEDVKDALEDIPDEGADVDGSMKVSTAELLTQEPPLSISVEKQLVVKVSEVTEIVEEEMEDAEEEEEGKEPLSQDLGEDAEDSRELEEMQDVEQTEPPAEEEVIIEETIVTRMVIESSAENSVPAESASAEEPSQVPETTAQQTASQLQPVVSSQDESSASVYPASTQSNPKVSKQDISTTEDDSQQSASHIQSSIEPSQVTPVIPATKPRVPPRPAYRPIPSTSIPSTSKPSPQMSPPKGTPFLPVPPASAQIQVHETPFPNQGPVKRQQMFTGSTSHISATAPANLSPVKRPAEEIRGKHKRHRHIGPIVPQFRKRERKMMNDLETILQEDRKKFAARVEKAPVQTEKEDVMEDIIHESLEADKPVEKIEPKILPTSSAKVRSQPPRESSPPDDTEKPQSPIESSPPAIISPRQPSPSAQRIVSPEIPSPEIPDTQDDSQIPDVQPQNNSQAPDDSQIPDDSQAYDPAHSRWGRFAAHWRRFNDFS
jgi:hypothetical protein